MCYFISLKHLLNNFLFSKSYTWTWVNITSTGRFIMFSVITNIYNNNNCSQPQENWKSFFWQLEMFDVCTTGDTAHTDATVKFWPHTRVNMCQHGHYIHSHRLAAEIWTTMKNNLLGKKFLICSFYMYRFRKYVSYGFPIINFCNPGVHYETPCITIKWGQAVAQLVEALRYKLEDRGFDSRCCHWNFSLR
jgi:hypothetical protein